jgi:3'-phosphoadenosine 5'-phosphosulfate sulfotransferase (PAPS reductase)/FAD synthetase
MDVSDPDITFDANGVCNHCRQFDLVYKPVLNRATSSDGPARLAALVDSIKAQGAGKDYDCIIGISGGVDSTYVAWKVKELGLRPLAVHFDSGWNSELAVANIEKLVKRLGFDLHTFVVDWEEMADLQLDRPRLSCGLVSRRRQIRREDVHQRRQSCNREHSPDGLGL